MRRWIILMIITLAIVNTSFLLEYVVSKTNMCNASCLSNGYKSGNCKELPLTKNICEAKGFSADSSYTRFCQNNGVKTGFSNVCCCE